MNLLPSFHRVMNVIHNEQEQVSGDQDHSDENEVHSYSEFEHFVDTDVLDWDPILEG